jgi:hypothetical protein
MADVTFEPVACFLSGEGRKADAMPPIGKLPGATPGAVARTPGGDPIGPTATPLAELPDVVNPDSFITSTATIAGRQVVLPDDQFRVTLGEPMRLVLGQELDSAQAQFSIPLSSMIPPLSPEATARLSSATVFPPWAESGRSIPIQLVDLGDQARLQVTITAADPAAMRKVPLLLMLNFRDGQARSVEVRSPSFVADRTAFQFAEVQARLSGLDKAPAEEPIPNGYSG